MDFRNLNKACPKDEFPLPNIDLFIDSTAGNSMFSFVDGYNGYNQICMATKDKKKKKNNNNNNNFQDPNGKFLLYSNVIYPQECRDHIPAHHDNDLSWYDASIDGRPCR